MNDHIPEGIMLKLELLVHEDCNYLKRIEHVRLSSLRFWTQEMYVPRDFSKMAKSTYGVSPLNGFTRRSER
ncbi:hypothetical protein M0804_007632 [Polistes exclamans]|nr:hypothetical protein M0804_007632 [Polistes exclamans]